MQEDVNKKINRILHSTQGSHRAKPKTNLLASIERKIYGLEENIIPMNRIRLAAAAAVIMLMLNISVLNNYLQHNGEVTVEQTTALITDFKLYD